MALLQGPIPKGFGKDNSCTVALPPPNGGAVGWGPVYLSVCTGYGDGLIRAAVFNSRTGEYRVMQVLAKRLGGRVSILIQDGDEKVDLERVPIDANDRGDCNVTWMLESTLRAA